MFETSSTTRITACSEDGHEYMRTAIGAGYETWGALSPKGITHVLLVERDRQEPVQCSCAEYGSQAPRECKHMRELSRLLDKAVVGENLQIVHSPPRYVLVRAHSVDQANKLLAENADRGYKLLSTETTMQNGVSFTLIFEREAR